MDFLPDTKVVVAIGSTLALAFYLFPFGDFKQRSQEYRLHVLSYQLILCSFIGITAWVGSPKETVQWLVYTFGMITIGLSIVFTGFNNVKPYLTKLAFLALVVYIFTIVV